MVNINEYVWNHRTTKDTKFVNSEFEFACQMCMPSENESPEMGPAIHALGL